VTRRPAPAPYGRRAISDLIPSLLAALGVEGFANPLEIRDLRSAAVLMIDGLGHVQLQEHPEAAPRLAKAASEHEPLTVGFPATTATSLASLTTGVPPGQHGLMGYTVGIEGHDRPMNLLLWELYGHGPDTPLTDLLPPERFQLAPTLFERAAGVGLMVTAVGPAAHAHSALTRAILRRARYEGADSLDELVPAVAAALSAGGLVYAYHPALDFHGHVSGPGSDAWSDELAAIDRAVEALVERLPTDSVLVVTGDHGMVPLVGDQKIDVADEPELSAGVRFLAGEARARHVVAVPGAARDVLAIWREVVGDRMNILSRDEAVEAGWFGPVVLPEAGERIGDVVAAAHDGVGVMQREVDPLQASLSGHHGSLTDAERLVPLALFGRG
jgi:hypothetical protein